MKYPPEEGKLLLEPIALKHKYIMAINQKERVNAFLY